MLGKILSYDVLINNWDRFPFLWRPGSDEGNIDNILFKPGDLIVPAVPIDQCISSIKNTGPSVTNFKTYVEKVSGQLILLFMFFIDQ